MHEETPQCFPGQLEKKRRNLALKALPSLDHFEPHASQYSLSPAWLSLSSCLSAFTSFAAWTEQHRGLY